MVLLEIRKSLNYLYLRSKYSVMNMAEYRMDMLMAAMGTYGYTIVMIIFLNFLLDAFDTIAGWNKYEVLALFCTGQLIFYTLFAFFWHLVSGLSSDIENGGIDKYLTKPVNAALNMSTANVQVPQALSNIPLLIAIYYIVIVNIGPFDFTTISIYVLSVIISFIIYLCVTFTLAILSFWFTDTSDLSRIFFDSFSEFSRYPIDIYPGGFKLLFLTIIPIGLIAYVPSYFLVKEFSWELFLLQFIVMLVFILLARITWVRGFRRYSSASS